MKKWDKYKEHRIEIYNYFKVNLNPIEYYLPCGRQDCYDVAFCLPIIMKDFKKVDKVKKILKESSIESRSFISGNMLRQTPYQKYGNYKDYKNAEFINNQALYIGLNMNTTIKDVNKLIKKLNSI